MGSRGGQRRTRLVRAVVLIGVVAGVLVSGASALRFSDESYLVPEGVVGQAYTHRFTGPPPEQEGRGCDPPYIFLIDSGGLPPGLSLSRDGLISGIPTQSGSWSFYVSMHDDPTDKPWCNPASAEREFTIKVVPGVPRLVIGPESAAPGTVGAAYSLAMTANLSDTKTWSIVSGVLPPGLTIRSSDGLISGTPTSAGTYPFTVQAAISPTRTDTKGLTIVVRDPLRITAPASFAAATHVAHGELGVTFEAAFVATGGSGTTTWSLSAGSLPVGIALGPDGRIAGRATASGTYRFALAAADDEGRRAALTATLTVAPRLALVTRRLPSTSVGHAYHARFLAQGGVPPMRWSLLGRLPGLHLDSARGLLLGIPRKAGTYRFTVAAIDALGVRQVRALRLVVHP